MAHPCRWRRWLARKNRTLRVSRTRRRIPRRHGPGVPAGGRRQRGRDPPARIPRQPDARAAWGERVQCRCKRAGMRIFLTGLIALLLGCATLSTPMERLVVGVQSTKPDETRLAWEPLVRDRARSLGVPGEVHAAPQAEIVKALGDGRIDVAWLSSSAAIDAVAQSRAEVFAVYRHLSGSE